jgi:hypothetical protein
VPPSGSRDRNARSGSAVDPLDPCQAFAQHGPADIQIPGRLRNAPSRVDQSLHLRNGPDGRACLCAARFSSDLVYAS